MNIKEKVIEYLNENTPSLHPEDLMKGLEIEERESVTFISLLDSMVEEGLLISTRKKKYALPEASGYMVGRIQGNPRGFGFFIPDKEAEEDIFIPADGLNGAMHKDRVMIRVISNPFGSHKSKEGEVYRVLDRANPTIVGNFEMERNYGFVVPDDTRINRDIFIHRDNFNNAKNGFKVVVEIFRWADGRRNPEGRIIDVLGHKDDAGMDTLSVMKQYNLSVDFPEVVSRAASIIPTKISQKDLEAREDFRDLKTFTMDGADAKDLDDAISIEKLDKGRFLLGVHISDVNHYVRKNSIIDKEAYDRATSVYLADMVVPMLPKELSNGICSLNPNEDRLTMSVMMTIDSNGRVVDHSIHESVINSKMRMTYDHVSSILEEEGNVDREIYESYKDFIEEIKIAKELSEILNKKKSKRGSIDFDLKESFIEFDEYGKVVDIKLSERGIANRIIEEFMIVCNETVAEHVKWMDIPSVYRVHEDPDPEKIKDFSEFVHNLGYSLKLGKDGIHPKTLADLLGEIKSTPVETLISSIMLRSLQKAKYSVDNLGHFGLASDSYCHFTAPIRRYPDLIVHRILKDSMHGRLSRKRIENLEHTLPSLAEHSSKKERLADEAERDIDDLKKAEYMKDRIGRTYNGIISGVTGFGIYVELPNTVEGLVRISSIEDDYYHFVEKGYYIIGERNRKIFRFGDPVKIKVTNVDLVMGNIDFILVD